MLPPGCLILGWQFPRWEVWALALLQAGRCESAQLLSPSHPASHPGPGQVWWPVCFVTQLSSWYWGDAALLGVCWKAVSWGKRQQVMRPSPSPGHGGEERSQVAQGLGSGCVLQGWRGGSWKAEMSSLGRLSGPAHAQHAHTHAHNHGWPSGYLICLGSGYPHLAILMCCSPSSQGTSGKAGK